MRGLIAVCTAACLGSCSPAPSVLEQIAGLGVLRVVTHNSPATFYYDDGKTPRGIEYELARGFAERLGVELEIYTAERFAELFPDVTRRRAHIGAASLAVTEPGERLVTFGPDYQQVEHHVIYRRGTARPRTVEDLAGGWIEIAARSTHAQVLETARRQVPGLTWATDPAATAEILIRRVAHGDIDYAIVDSNEYQLLRQYYPEAQAAFNLGPSRRVAWALPRAAPMLRERVAAYFAEIEATGELRRILDRHFFAAQDFDYVGSRAFVRHLKTRLPLYRAYFEEAEARTGLDWRLLAAVSYQESHWNPEAVSPTGVRGLMMLTQSTAAMMGVAERDDPEQSILGGARYLERVKAKVPERIPEPDRTWLAIAAYNIGFGHLEDGRIVTEIRGGDPDSWDDVREHLPLLSEEQWYSRLEHGFARGIVPVGYVENIRRYHALLQWMTDTELLTDETGPGAGGQG